MSTEQRWVFALLVADAALAGIFAAWAVEHTPWCWLMVAALVVAGGALLSAGRREDFRVR